MLITLEQSKTLIKLLRCRVGNTLCGRHTMICGNQLTWTTGERVRTLVSLSGWYAIYGLIRTDALRKTALFRDAYGADVLLLMELCLLGPFAKVPQTLFWYRQFAGKTEEDRAKTVHPETQCRPDYNVLLRGLIHAVRSSGLRADIKMLSIWDILSVVGSSESWRYRTGSSRIKALISSLRP